MLEDVLIVAGTYDSNGGKPSGLVEKIFGPHPLTLGTYNYCNGGGTPEELQHIFDTYVPSAKIIFWFPNVVEETPHKLVNRIKAVNPHCILIESKRNNFEYSIQEVVAHMLNNKANLCLEFCDDHDPEYQGYLMSLLDPLGNCFVSTHNPKIMWETLAERVEFLQGITRCQTKPAPSWWWTERPQVEQEFLDIIHYYGNYFHWLLNPDPRSNRFLGNASFRCEKGFPSFRGSEGIFVTRRNVRKEMLAETDFIKVEEKDGEVLVHSDNKASVDAPVQLALYKALPHVNYMLHGHVDFVGAPITDNIVPCGGMEEVAEVLSLIKIFGNIRYVNLRGHGSLILARTLSDFYGPQFTARKIGGAHHVVRKTEE